MTRGTTSLSKRLSFRPLTQNAMKLFFLLRPASLLQAPFDSSQTPGFHPFSRLSIVCQMKLLVPFFDFYDIINSISKLYGNFQSCKEVIVTFLQKPLKYSFKDQFDKKMERVGLGEKIKFFFIHF